MSKLRQKRMTAGDMTLLAGYLRPEVTAVLMASRVPHSLCGRNVPKDLNGLTLDALEDIALSEGMDLKARILTVARAVLGDVDAGRLMRSDAGAVCGLIRFAADECRRITALFAALRRDHTEDERAAGIDSLNFGIFGLADWYARRMGIADHDEAKRTPWVRIYKCVEMDFKEGEFRRRLAEIQQKRAEARLRSRRR
ncbi:MAG: hypothetical protein LUC33_00565 [Prevotellaceae bacterium]|nr:hypothetical protein [Prevotellaceae bacterium]